MDLNGLKVALNATMKSFEDGELAYLALTAKIERHIVERLSWQLHKQSVTRQDKILKEWRNILTAAARADLVVINGDLPLMIVEAKACYSFDLARASDRRFDQPSFLAKDLERWHRHASKLGEPTIIGLLLVTHLNAERDHNFGRSIKYEQSVCRSLRNLGHKEIESRADATLETWKLNYCFRFHFDHKFEVGKHCGCDVSIRAMLVQRE